MATDGNFNALRYIFYVNNFNIFSNNKIPSIVVLKNQKNLFSFLTACYDCNFKIIYISSFFKKNSLKAFNMLYSFQKLAITQTTVVMVLENTLSKSLVSKLINSKLLFIKPILDPLDFNLNIYPIFINLDDYLKVFAYSTVLKLFFKNLLIQNKNKKNSIFFFKFFNFKKNFLI